MSRYTEIEKHDKVGPSRVTINNNFQSLESLIVENENNTNWKESVLTFTDEGSASQTLGNRYISNTTGAEWIENYIYEWDSSWIEIIPDNGTTCLVEDEGRFYLFNGTIWVKLTSIIIHNDLSGIQGGSLTERYHALTLHHNYLTAGVDAQIIHYHDLETTAPVSNTDIGVEGQWAKDINYYYHCVSTDTWVRRPVETAFVSSP